MVLANDLLGEGMHAKILTELTVSAVGILAHV